MTPYFYIIKHKKTGKKYAGCRYAKTCDPKELLKERGYKTSSKTVRKMIHEEGLDSFEVVEIILEEEIKIPFGCLSVLDYESWFIENKNCIKSEEWLNLGNSKVPFGSEEFKMRMLKKYGVENASKMKNFKEKVKNKWEKKTEEDLKTIKQKKEETTFKNHGVSHHLKSDLIKEKRKQTCFEKYGEEFPIQTEEVKEKSKKTMIEKYGVENAAQSEEFKQKTKQTCFEKYGVEFSFQSEELREKAKKTMIEKYGTEIPLRSKEIKEKFKKTSLEKYGFESPNQSPLVREKKRIASKNKSEREIVKTMREISKKYDVKFGKGWYCRSDEWLKEKLEEVKKKLNLSS